MKSTTFLLLQGLALTAYASTIQVTANFDNLTAPEVPSPTAGVGTYEYITYDSFSLADTATNVLGIASHTEPNTIVTDTETSLNNGTPSLTIASPYTSFGLTDFWFGCAADTSEAVASTAIQCTITVAGFESSSDAEVAVASFTFRPPGVDLSSVPMIHAVLPSTFLLPGIKNVTIIQDDPTTRRWLLTVLATTFPNEGTKWYQAGSIEQSIVGFPWRPDCQIVP